MVSEQKRAVREEDARPTIPQSLVAQATAAAAANSDDSRDPSVPPSNDSPHHVGHDDHGENYQDDRYVPPPAYGEHYGAIESDQDGFGTKASMAEDGRINIRIDQRSRRLSNLLVPALRSQVNLIEKDHDLPPAYIPPSLGGRPGEAPPPPLNVVIHVVGSRGDVQPFVALGKVLKETYGHRVRLATHPVFKDFVTENGLEFFSISGDPAELMAFMVKNPGLMPGFDTLRSGDIGKRRKQIADMVRGCWRSCIEAGDGFGPEASDSTIEDWATEESLVGGDPTAKPFVADAIIANPPSFAHIHCAEKLAVPLHMMFTMPWSPTQAFPHPLANIQSSNADAHISNFMSYALVDMMTWQGLGDVINRFRQKSLGLEPISLMWAPGMLSRLRIPYTYCWSPALIPKPKDWAKHISISGFYFLSLASNYTPDPDLKAFLDAGPPPVYIGFGSIVVDDPNGMTTLIFDAVKKSGQRALVSKGWGGLGADQLGVPDGVFMLGNVPHDWLFKHVSCVVHHGGAGTTAAGIATGKPTVVVPFFGDQLFWGAMVAKAGAGPAPIPYKHLNADKLAEAITEALKPTSLERAQELAERISQERGSDTGAQSFHQMLDVEKMRCSIAPSRVAVWRIKRTDVRLSALAATVLGNEGLLDFNDLKLYRAREYETEDGPWDPITGGASALVGTLGSLMMGVADLPTEALKALRIHPDANPNKKEIDDPKSPSTEKSSTNTLTEQSDSSLNASSASLASGTSPNTTSANTPFNFSESPSKVTSGESLPDWQSITSPGGRSSMVDALRGNLGRRPSSRSNSCSRTTSLSRSSSPQRSATTGGAKRESSFGLEAALGTGRGVSRMVGAGLKSPMDFTMGIARGFHNAPKLYGDESVRKADQITDFRSGLKAATKEFGFGFYDGITGLVTQPIEGAKKGGAAGFLKGFGKGIGGLVLKPGAAIWGIPGYTFKGIYKEIQQRLGSSVQNYIIAARTAQGFDEWHHSSSHERADIVKRWNIIRKDLKKKKNPGQEQIEQFQALLADQKQKKKLWETDKQREKKKNKKDKGRRGSTGDVKHPDEEYYGHHDVPEGSPGPSSGLHHVRTVPRTQDAEDIEDADFEQAIRLSVQETSKGDPEEDEQIERAIRASVAELQRQPQHGRQQYDDVEAIHRAMEASIVEARASGDVEHTEAMEAALKESIEHQRHERAVDSEGDSGSVTENDEHYQMAVRESKRPARAGNTNGGYDDDDTDDGHDVELGKAMEASHASHAEESRAKSEEDIVLEYIKKQSLAEEELRKSLAEKKTGDKRTG
ncbi:hypothetical protein LTR66_012461 [Elasticomyces elasticus]|nr:hypothetical protein LTR66_012461 [Elasticomyces elasticus]